MSTPPQNIYMSPVQKKLHDQLQQKARQVQDAIMRQQEELRTITEQLSFAKQGTVPMVGPPSGEYRFCLTGTVRMEIQVFMPP